MPIHDNVEFYARYRERLRRRSDSEHTQALLRILIVLAIVATGRVMVAQAFASRPAMWVVAACSLLFSLLLFVRIVARPEPSRGRRIAGMIHDNVCATIWLALAGPSGALALFVFPFVTVGNGFRFGVKYLALSGLLGLAHRLPLSACAGVELAHPRSGPVCF